MFPVVCKELVALPVGKALEEITTDPVSQAVILLSREVVSPAIVARLVFAVDWFDAVAKPVICPSSIETFKFDPVDKEAGNPAPCKDDVAAPDGKALEEITTAPVLQAVILPSIEVVSPSIVERWPIIVVWLAAEASPPPLIDTTFTSKLPEASTFNALPFPPLLSYPKTNEVALELPSPIDPVLLISLRVALLAVVKSVSTPAISTSKLSTETSKVSVLAVIFCNSKIVLFWSVAKLSLWCDLWWLI